MPRIACLAAHSFSLAARLRAEPELRGESLAILHRDGTMERVAAASRPARRAGVRPGLTLPQARALLPDLVVRHRDPICERAAQEALLEAAEGFSPRVEDAGEGVAYLDLEGLDRHFPGGSFELDLGRSLLAAAAAVGLPARAGIGGSKLAARVAADLPDSPVVVPAGGEAAFLAPLSLDRLTPPAELDATLRVWGVRVVGDFARLPEDDVADRLGRAGRELHAAARGIDPRPLIPREPPPTLQEGMELEWALTALEPFLFVGRGALERLCQRLESRGLACARLQLDLRLDPEGHLTRTLDLPAPLRDPKALLTLVRLDLEAHPPQAPAVGFTFTAHPGRLRETQLSLFGPAALSPDQLAATLGRLAAIVGPDRVGSPGLVDGFLPERFALDTYAPPAPPEAPCEPRGGSGRFTVRVVRPAVEVEVITGAGEIPIEVRSESSRGPRIQGRVRTASGPWELEEGWWGEGAAEREYWDVELSDQGIYRLFREPESGTWFADGIYD
ncbi:MAG TPA: DNA polymerase Y family protein [Thermoanaerobaculia bacterium]|jgi:protein ImuB|nr:DNA polymerase Y family protein [Thermoanaerobaculia bacterium]